MGTWGFTRPQHGCTVGLFQGQTYSGTDRWVVWFQRAQGSLGWGEGIRLRLSSTDDMSVQTALHVKVVSPKSSCHVRAEDWILYSSRRRTVGAKLLIDLCQPLTVQEHPFSHTALCAASYH